jgi:hypothetical protein
MRGINKLVVNNIQIIPNYALPPPAPHSRPSIFCTFTIFSGIEISGFYTVGITINSGQHIVIDI